MIQKLPISVIFLTLNEEYHLPKAIDNIKPWVQEVFVVDSLSSDKTVEIALKKGAKVVQRPFTNFGDQWNYALQNLPINTPWTMKMDPDERFSIELIESISNILIDNSSEIMGLSFNRQLWFMQKPINVFDEVLRIWKTGHCRFSDVIVNEHPIVTGKTIKIKGNMNHLDSKNLHEWYEKQNRYSTLEARSKLTSKKLAFEPDFFGNLKERKMFFKRHFYSIPFRYSLYWFYLFVKNKLWKSGFVGREWVSCRVEIMKMRYRKYFEMKATNKEYDLLDNREVRKFNQTVLNSDIQKSFVK